MPNPVLRVRASSFIFSGEFAAARCITFVKALPFAPNTNPLSVGSNRSLTPISRKILGDIDPNTLSPSGVTSTFLRTDAFHLNFRPSCIFLLTINTLCLVGLPIPASPLSSRSLLSASSLLSPPSPSSPLLPESSSPLKATNRLCRSSNSAAS